MSNISGVNNNNSSEELRNQTEIDPISDLLTRNIIEPQLNQ